MDVHKNRLVLNIVYLNTVGTIFNGLSRLHLLNILIL